MVIILSLDRVTSGTCLKQEGHIIEIRSIYLLHNIMKSMFPTFRNDTINKILLVVTSKWCSTQNAAYNRSKYWNWSVSFFPLKIFI